MNIQSITQLKQFILDSYDALYKTALRSFLAQLNAVDIRFHTLELDKWLSIPKRYFGMTEDIQFEVNGTQGKMEFGPDGCIFSLKFPILRVTDDRRGGIYYRYKHEFDNYKDFTAKEIVDIAIKLEEKRSKKIKAAKLKNQTVKDI